jgi:hypothetical protein
MRRRDSTIVFQGSDADVLSRGDPTMARSTGRQRNLIEPVHFSTRYFFDRTSTASNKNLVGGDAMASTSI